MAATPPTNTDTMRRPQGVRAELKESLIAADLTIEVGARVTGQVRASTVIVGGELHGNIEAAVRVEVQETGMGVGDVKGGSLTVAAGSRMRGQVEFGWGEKSVSSLVAAKVDAAVS